MRKADLNQRDKKAIVLPGRARRQDVRLATSGEAEAATISDCTPELTGLYWANTGASTNGDGLEMIFAAEQTVSTDNVSPADIRGSTYNRVASFDAFGWAARVLGCDCCQCEYEWTATWSKDPASPTGAQPIIHTSGPFMHVWITSAGLAIPTSGAGSPDVHEYGDYDISVEVTCNGVIQTLDNDSISLVLSYLASAGS